MRENRGVLIARSDFAGDPTAPMTARMYCNRDSSVLLMLTIGRRPSSLCVRVSVMLPSPSTMPATYAASVADNSRMCGIIASRGSRP